MICAVEECTGCGCCKAVCPANCITMKLGADNRRLPEIDSEKCISCGLCRKKCPVMQTDSLQDRIFPLVYRAQHKDEKILKRSASGGAFTILADYIFSRHGIVIGAVWESDFSVSFQIAHNRDELEAMHGSKYVESHLETEMFHTIKTELEKGRYVLFCGLPCQCAALKSYLSSDYDTFINVDIVCQGVAPSSLLQKHIEYLNRSGNSPVLSINQTSKRNGWSILIQKLIHYGFLDNTSAYIDRTEDFYLNNFLNHLFFHECCYHCHFASMPRKTDFTIGDFFGLGAIQKANNLDTLGTSMMMVNTKKAYLLMGALSPYGNFEKRELKEALYFNHNLLKPSTRNPRREEFYRDSASLDWEELCRKYQSKNMLQKMNILIRKWIKKILGDRLACRLVLLYNRFSGQVKQADDIISYMERNLQKAENDE